MTFNEREHKQTIERLEEKFFEEKMHLQHESNKKIEEIATRAQDEALKYEKNLSIIPSHFLGILFFIYSGV